GPERYVAIGDGRVLLADLAGAAPDRSPDSFRERRLFPLEPDAISRIAVQRSSGRLTIARRGGAWRLEEPLADLADFGSADGLARSVTTLAVASAGAAESPNDRPGARPSPEISLMVESKEGTLSASIGASNGKGERPAWKADGRAAGAVPDAGVAELLRP